MTFWIGFIVGFLVCAVCCIVLACWSVTHDRNDSGYHMKDEIQIDNIKHRW